jgi:enoyl-CoA hydratase/carnithine racemase
MSEALIVSRQGHVATVTLNRPAKHNAINLELFAAIAEAGIALAADASVRAIVLQGEGPSFCAGIDLSVLQNAGEELSPEMLQPVDGSVANFFQRAAYVWREVPVPVLCAVQGNVFGAGLQLALGADLRYASSDSRFSVMEIKWGIIPDIAITTTLTRLIPADKAKELAWTGRVFDASEAAEMGIVTALSDDPRGAAQDTAAAIAAHSPGAIRAIKRLFDESAHLSDADALQLEARLQAALLGRPDQREAVAANLEKRTPDFTD